MANNNEKYVQFQITISQSDLKRWKEVKRKKYNGLKAMSKMIRDYVEDGIKREEEAGIL